MTKYGAWDIGGEVIKMDERYIVKDNKELKTLTLSSIRLYPHKNTSGHSHEGQEEVYFFVEGSGTMTVGSEDFEVHVGDTVTVPDGAYHQVIAHKLGCSFITVFPGQRRR